MNNSNVCIMFVRCFNDVRKLGEIFVFQTEEELVERLTKHFHRYFIVRELGVGYGISDLLIIRNKTDLKRFIQARNGKYLKHSDEVKIFDYIRKRNGVEIDELVSKNYVSKTKLKYTILNHLLEIGAIYMQDNKYIRTPEFSLFSPISTAIEAKLENWNKGLAQAIRYQRFAQKTYLAMDERYVHRAHKSEFIKYNVGLISVGSKVKEVVQPLERKPLDPIMRYKVSEEIISKTVSKSEKHHLSLT